MAYVRLGTATKHNIVEFLVFNSDNIQCGTIYYAKGTSEYSFSVECETIGEIPSSIKKEQNKLEKIAETALRR